MKKLSAFLFAMALVFGVVGTANSALQTIGTASYDPDGVYGADPIGEFNLIYEDNSIAGGLVWLDYTKAGDSWQTQVNWASGLGSNLTVNLDPNYTTDIDWTTGWRLPLIQDATPGYNVTGSEMGHLYYVSLGNIAYNDPGWGLNNVGDFNQLRNYDYWSGTESSVDPGNAHHFQFNLGIQGDDPKEWGKFALAVRPGTVTAVPPIPTVSEWGMMIFFIFLVGSALWVVRGRTRQKSA